LDVKYEYHISNKKYFGKTLNFHDCYPPIRGENRKSALQKASESGIFEGAKITIKYNPNSPQDSVVFREEWKELFICVITHTIIWGIIVFFLLFLIIYSFFNKNACTSPKSSYSILTPK
jgi:hypothetical protein